jgi:hypothetical protein
MVSKLRRDDKRRKGSAIQTINLFSGEPTIEQEINENGTSPGISAVGKSEIIEIMGHIT